MADSVVFLVIDSAGAVSDGPADEYQTDGDVHRVAGHAIGTDSHQMPRPALIRSLRSGMNGQARLRVAPPLRSP